MGTNTAKDEHCGTCRYHRYDKNSQDYICTCPESEFIRVIAQYLIDQADELCVVECSDNDGEIRIRLMHTKGQADVK